MGTEYANNIVSIPWFWFYTLFPPPYFVQKVGDKRRAVTKFSILVLLAGYRVSRHDSNSGRLITSPSMVFLSGAGATFQMPTLCNPHRTRIAPLWGKRQLSCLSAFNLPITLELAEHSQLGLAMHTWRYFRFLCCIITNRNP